MCERVIVDFVNISNDQNLFSPLHENVSMKEEIFYKEIFLSDNAMFKGIEAFR